MDTKQIAATLKGMSEFEGANIEVQMKGKQVVVGDFFKVANKEAATEILQSMGFGSIFPGVAIYDSRDFNKSIRERYEEMTPEEQKQADIWWVKMGGHLA